MENSNNTPASDISNNASNSDISEQVEKSSNIYQGNDDRSSITPETNSNVTHKQVISQIKLAPASDMTDNASNPDELNNAFSNSDICQGTKIQCSASTTCVETKSFCEAGLEVEDEEIEFFTRSRSNTKELYTQNRSECFRRTY